MFARSCSFLVAALGGALVVPAADVEPSSDVRGVTITCPGWGQVWGTDLFAEELDDLVGLGVNWVAIHPYARVHVDGHLSWREVDPDAPPEWLARPLREAHERGISLLLKPHIAYWGSPFGWRGEIEFADPEATARFWSDYRNWIVELARAIPDVDALVVGTELDRFLDDDSQWRGLIRDLRAVTDAHLTYASNWTDYERVTFWDALDAVGVQAYFPLTDSAEVPAAEDLMRGWEPVLAALRAAHQRTGKPVVFTEFGYNLSLKAAREPWAYATERGPDRDSAERLQALCLEVGLQVLNNERSWLRGAFLWKWFPGEGRRSNFRLDTPPLRAVMGAAWRE